MHTSGRRSAATITFLYGPFWGRHLGRTAVNANATCSWSRIQPTDRAPFRCRLSPFSPSFFMFLSRLGWTRKLLLSDARAWDACLAMALISWSKQSCFGLRFECRLEYMQLNATFIISKSSNSNVERQTQNVCRCPPVRILESGNDSLRSFGLVPALAFLGRPCPPCCRLSTSRLHLVTTNIVRSSCDRGHWR